WWLIGISIVAANLSTEQFVGMAGQAAGDVGFAVSSWQILSSIAVVVVALFFLPRLLRTGIYTMPEFLEYRYNEAARAMMSILMVTVYALVTTAAVLYSGGTALETIFGIDLLTAVLIIAGVAAVYVVWGGLLAAVWADLLQGTALLIGGLLTTWIGIEACGGLGTFLQANADKMHLILPRSHPELPWTTLIGGIWIPILYYCGFNQFIMQRSLGARSLKHAQLGVIFAGTLWLLVPVAIVLPGIVAHQLYGETLSRMDQAYPTLIRNLMPEGLRALIFAALVGAVISSVAAMLNAGSTIFTMDIWKRYLHKSATEANLVLTGRITSVVFLLIAGVVSLTGLLKGGVFAFIQEFQGYVSPGILAAFVFGFAVKKTPPAAGVAALVVSAPLYGLLQWQWGDVPYLHRMLVTFASLVALMGVITALRPLQVPRTLPVREELDMESSAVVVVWGALLIGAVAAYYLVFP
ncbi:MAG: sodium/solute symporter, partial [Acidobacteria bacterium]|nr:sodium/solute symporter [Acidobacteriota bacterium]